MVSQSNPLAAKDRSVIVLEPADVAEVDAADVFAAELTDEVCSLLYWNMTSAPRRAADGMM
jgi:hypothetical protein